MRLKIILPVLVLGGLIVASTLWLRPRAQRAPPPSPALAPAAAPAIPEATQAPTPPGPKPAAAQTAPETAPGAADTGPDSPEDRQQAYVARRVAELQDLASDDAPASLDTILSELTNRDPEIRQAAREAAVQFGSRDAIPKLMEAIGQTEDVQEKAALQEAAEFLKLPTPAELAGTAGAGHPPPRNGARPGPPPR